MGNQYLSEIRMTAFVFAPKGWALCNGQTLPINQNQALFSLLGTTYGGNGVTNFQLPNLQGRLPMHYGGQYLLGAAAGQETHTLIANEIPSHSHFLIGSSTAPDQPSALNGYWPTEGALTPYAPSPNNLMASQALGGLGALPHENRPPFLVINFIIALQGIFPSRN